MGEKWRSRRPVVMGVVVLVALPASCGGQASHPGHAVEDGGLPREVCDRVSGLEQVNASLVGPDVFEHNAAGLREILGEERDLLKRIADRSTGDLQRRLRRQLLSQQALNEAILERWDQARASLASEHDDGPWIPRILDDAVHRSDGAAVDVDDFAGLAYANYWELVVRCRGRRWPIGHERRRARIRRRAA